MVTVVISLVFPLEIYSRDFIRNFPKIKIDWKNIEKFHRPIRKQRRTLYNFFTIYLFFFLKKLTMFTPPPVSTIRPDVCVDLLLVIVFISNFHLSGSNVNRWWATTRWSIRFETIWTANEYQRTFFSSNIWCSTTITTRKSDICCFKSNSITTSSWTSIGICSSVNAGKLKIFWKFDMTDALDWLWTIACLSRKNSLWYWNSLLSECFSIP